MFRRREALFVPEFGPPILHRPFAEIRVSLLAHQDRDVMACVIPPLLKPLLLEARCQVVHMFDAEASVPSIAVIRDHPPRRDLVQPGEPEVLDQLVQQGQFFLVPLGVVGHNDPRLGITRARHAALNTAIEHILGTARVTKPAHLLLPLLHAGLGCPSPVHRARELHDFAARGLFELDLILLPPSLQLPDAANAGDRAIVIQHDRVHFHRHAVEGHLNSSHLDLGPDAVDPVALQSLDGDRRCGNWFRRLLHDHVRLRRWR
mmetsp:Transcript_40936/g.81420  ORF Transcript_40936/g.81420 Transcript_40936/m.81420 type:complete len:261 (+) Transcript_40936:422-1204(+)